MSARITQTSTEKERNKKDEYKGIKFYEGGHEGLEEWDDNIDEWARNQGGEPWATIWKDEHVEITDANVKEIAEEMRNASIDPSDSIAGAKEPTPKFYELRFQKIVRERTLTSIYHIAFKTTKGRAKEAIKRLGNKQSNKIREKLYGRWGDLQTANKQALKARFSAGITNADKVTKFEDEERGDVKDHFEMLENMQASLRKKTKKEERDTDTTLSIENLRTIATTSLGSKYMPTLQSFIDAEETKQDISDIMVARGGAAPTAETEEHKWERLKNSIYNFYESEKRRWQKEDQRQAYNDAHGGIGGAAPSTIGGTPAFLTHQPQEQTGQRPPSRKPCFYHFQKGYCQNSTHCRFSHDPAYHDETQPLTLPTMEARCWDCNQTGHKKGDTRCGKPGAQLNYPAWMKKKRARATEDDDGLERPAQVARTNTNNGNTNNENTNTASLAVAAGKNDDEKEINDSPMFKALTKNLHW
jgi:hypothetical protein